MAFSLSCLRQLKTLKLTRQITFGSSCALWKDKKFPGEENQVFREISNVTVIGGGSMGSGIATLAATNDFNVVIVDEEDEHLQKAMVMIRRTLDRLTKNKFPMEPRGGRKFIQDTLANITPTLSLTKAVASADIIIEAVNEDIDLKIRLFKNLCQMAPPHAILVSNTSSLPISVLAQATNRPDKVGGLHFNPVLQVKLVEVIKSPQMSDATFQSLMNFSRNLGKYPAVCKDTPGFIVNRLLVPFIMDAINMLDQGVAKIEDIDFALREGAGYAMGPFQMADELGLDLVLDVAKSMHKGSPDHIYYKPSKRLQKMVDEGKLGWKTEIGFYDYGSPAGGHYNAQPKTKPS